MMATRERPTSAANPADGSPDRVADLLDAACRVISQVGSARVRMQDIAREAKVSKALVHYYFVTREELLTRAFVHGQIRGRERVHAEISPLAEGRTRLARLLLFYFEDEPIVAEQWRIWNELCSSAVFQPELRGFMENSFQTWVAWIESTIRDGIADGSIAPSVDPGPTAFRLAVLVDGLGSAVVRGLTDLARAREVVSQALAREVEPAGEQQSDSRTAAEAGTSPSNATYLRRLVGVIGEAVAGLESFASRDEDRDGIEAVCALLGRMAGDDWLHVEHTLAPTPVTTHRQNQERSSKRY